MICKVCLWLIFSICMEVWDTVSTAKIQGVSQLTPMLMVKTGTNAILECFVSSQNEKDPLVWYKQSVGQRPRVMGSALHFVPPILYGEFNNKSRFSINVGSGSFHLSISNIQRSDEASYFCGVRIVYDIHFANGTYLFVEDKGQLRSNIANMTQVILSDPVPPGTSQTLECVVLAETRTEDLKVFWFRPSSGGSLPGVIYTNKSWSGPCEGRCVYSLSKKDVNISDAGTYYCAIAISGQILFGNGTAIVIAEPLDTVIGLVVALGCCVTLMLFLLWLNCNKRGTCDNHSGHDTRHIRDGSSDTRQRGVQSEAVDGLNYAPLSFSEKEPRGRRTKRETLEVAVYSDVNIKR